MSTAPFKKGDRETHLRLARGMVEHTNADLGDRVVDGGITAASLGTILGRCQQCPYPASCQAWQADHAGEHGAAPPYCLNRDLFGDLAAE